MTPDKPVAFATPDTVYISIGKQLDCRAAAHVAMILSHELGHVLSRHGLERGWLEVTKAYINHVEAPGEENPRFVQSTPETNPSSTEGRRFLQRYQELEAD